MILLNKFIKPTFATGKTVESSFQHNKYLKEDLVTINIEGLYSSIKESYRDIIFPLPNIFYSIKKQNEKEIIGIPLFVDCHYKRNFAYKIYKNNKSISMSINTCKSCFSINSWLSIGKNMHFSHTYRCICYCCDCRLVDSCKVFGDYKVKNLYNTANVIKSYTRYLKSCN